MTTQNKKPQAANAFYAAGFAFAQSRAKLPSLFADIKKQDNDKAVESVTTILKGAHDAGQVAVDKAKADIAAAKTKAKAEQATANLVQALADQKAGVNAVWIACRQYTRLDIRDGNSLQFKAGVVKWLGSQVKAPKVDDKTTAHKAGDKADTKTVSALDQAKAATDILSNADLRALADYVTAKLASQAKATRKVKASVKPPKLAEVMSAEVKAA